jgi:hypothetical protein
MVYLSQEDTFANLFPSSSCQCPPSIMYSAPLQQLTHEPGFIHDPATTDADFGPAYGSPPAYSSMMESPYTPPSYWSPNESPIPQPISYATPDTSFIPRSTGPNRVSRSYSASSAGLGMPYSRSPSPLARSVSPNSPDLREYGFPNQDGTWSCAYPGCTSRAVFSRGCDLRKHHKRHTKSFFCHHEATGGGFSSKKDLARHEARHNPGVLCDWEGCDRVFSRVDNMVSSFRTR